LTRIRLNPAERRGQILRHAASIVVEQGYLPLPLETLARRSEISKALIYAYFPTQIDIVNDLIRRHLPQVVDGQFAALASTPDFEGQARACARAYFAHLAAHGPLLHILLSDLYARGQVDAELLRLRARAFGALARVVRGRLGLDARESLAAVRLFAALIEEAGSIAFRTPSAAPLCERVCLELVVGGLDGLAAASRRLGAGP
jgi:AcrR family transcriptional regulator